MTKFFVLEDKVAEKFFLDTSVNLYTFLRSLSDTRSIVSHSEDYYVYAAGSFDEATGKIVPDFTPVGELKELLSDRKKGLVENGN